jgi:RNA polymerase sigma-70 factor (ECF subfamily)
VERSPEEKERFLALLLPLRERLSRFARSITGDPEEAHDLVGDTILAALEGFAKVRSEKAFLSYLFTIAVRIQRRKRWRRRLFDRFDEPFAAKIVDTGTPADAGNDLELLHRALARLPERQREAVVLFEITGLSLEEIREIQGGSLSGVKSRVSRGRQELARLLGAVDRPVEREAKANGVASAGVGTPYLVYSETQSHG